MPIPPPSRTDFASTDRIQTRPMGIRRKKPAALPTSLEDIITRRFSKPVFKWLDTLTTYQNEGGSEESRDIPPRQNSEPFCSPIEPKSPEKTSTAVSRPRLEELKSSEEIDNQNITSSHLSQSFVFKTPEELASHVRINPSPKNPPATQSIGLKNPDKSAPCIQNAHSNPKLLEKQDKQLNASSPASKSTGPKSPEKPGPSQSSDFDLPRSCLPLGSCVAVDSGIVTSSYPQSLFDNLLDYFVGKQPSAPSALSSNITMDIICDALTESLEIILKSNPDLPLFPPPVCAVRAATLLKSLGKGSEISAFNSWFRVRTHVSKKKGLCPPKSPMLLFRLAQTSFLTCDLAKREDLLYHLSTFLAFNGYDSIPITCLLLAFQSCPTSTPSSLETVYQFLAWKEGERSPESNELVTALRQVAFYSSSPSVTLLRHFLSSLVNDFCYGRKGQEDTPENREDIARALRLLFTVYAFSELDVKKSAANRLGVALWLLKVRLLNWINSLKKGTEMSESTAKLLLRICSLTVDVVLLTAQLDMHINLPKTTTKVLSPCQRGLTYCTDKIFEFLISIPNTILEHTPDVS